MSKLIARDADGAAMIRPPYGTDARFGAVLYDANNRVICEADGFAHEDDAHRWLAMKSRGRRAVGLPCVVVPEPDDITLDARTGHHRPVAATEVCTPAEFDFDVYNGIRRT